MICFSDFILSQTPWAYCRLDEPVGYNTYHDLTGNKNHLSAYNGLQAANNRQSISLQGDPYIGGIRPLIENQVLSINNIDFDIPQSALQFKVPEFKSDTYKYNRRQKVQNSLKMNSMWIDFLMDPHISSYHETMKDWMPFIN